VMLSFATEFQADSDLGWLKRLTATVFPIACMRIANCIRSQRRSSLGAVFCDPLKEHVIHLIRYDTWPPGVGGRLGSGHGKVLIIHL